MAFWQPKKGPSNSLEQLRKQDYKNTTEILTASSKLLSTLTEGKNFLGQLQTPVGSTGLAVGSSTNPELNTIKKSV